MKSRPPTFALFCNTVKLPQFYERYLRSKLQNDFKLQGIPIRFLVRQTKGNEVKKELLRHGKQNKMGLGNKLSRGVGPNKRMKTSNTKMLRDKHMKIRKNSKRMKSKQSGRK